MGWQMSKRNLFFTKTAIGSYVAFLATLTAVAPNIEGILTRGKSEAEKLNIRDGFAIVIGFVGFAGTLLGRYDAGGVYTPKGLIGEDPPERLQ